MPGTTDIPGPSFISSHSADVILSEVRPIKLKIEALRSINVLLDEFLYNILSTACSLSTDKLRASLLSLLPTTLGKEALLEAEVELRAYWGRIGPQDAIVASPEDSAKTFHLQWVYKLLRLKCEAYSTLNESDEDPGAEEHITTTMSSAGCSPPKPTLIAPAALYLTAILEALCEHILSNVARVAARDSSRNHATLQDLFIALCEDQSIYTLFKTMKVYEEIEQLSKPPKARRSKSLTRNDRTHAGSPHPDPPMVKDGSSARSRLSSEGNGSTNTVPTANTRSSTEKTKAKNGHKRSESSVSELSGRGTPPVNDEGSVAFDDELQQEFDDLMRSSATMKVSLTPDRLKTMEVYKQEKDRRGNRRLASSSSTASSDPSSASPRGTAHRPSVLLHVQSIQEDEEENATKTPPLVSQNRIRHGSLSSPAESAESTQVGGRVRSMSAAPSIVAQDPALVPPQAHLTPNKLIQKRQALPGQDPHLSRPRKSQLNADPMSLDDIMAGSDEDHASLSETPKPKRVSSPSRPGKTSVSAGTRELMAFLAEGPPHVGPAPTSQRSVENGRSKGSGRLQRMISKLSLGNGDRSKNSSDELSRSKSTSTRHTPAKSSPSSVSSLANRPIPPRLLRPGSPNSPSRDASQETSYSSIRSRSGSLPQTKSKSAELRESPPPLPRETSPTGQQVVPTLNGQVDVNQVINGPEEVASAPTTLSHDTYTVDKAASDSVYPNKDFPIPHTLTAQAGSQANKPSLGCNINQHHISGDDAKKLRDLLSHATTADECRLLVDMFLVKSGIPSVSPPTPVTPRAEVIPVDEIENSIVEVLLDDL